MDFVEEVLRFLTARMQIEAEWAVQERTSFTWWAHTLAQRVWVARAARIPGRRAHDAAYRNRPACRRADGRGDVDAAGQRQSVRDAERVRRRHRAGHHPAAFVGLADGRELAARAIDRAACDGAADGGRLRAKQRSWRRRLAARSRRRRIRIAACATQPDEMVGILEIYQQRGEGDSPFDADEIARARPSRAAALDDGGQRAAAAGCGSGVRDRSAARLELDASERHASLGSGLQMRLLLPVEPDEAIAQKLNANECLEPDAHQLGAWCVDRERGLMFTGFVPAAAHTPGPVARAGLSPVGEERMGARVVVPVATA